jgi:branched-subunit amino acid ABC-type transport system permease component
MKLAFATGALASGLVGGGLTALVVWIATVVTGSGDPWAIAPVLVAAAAALVGGATYLAERIVYRRSMERQRAIGEPWAYRED